MARRKANKAQAIRNTFERLGLDTPSRHVIADLARRKIDVAPSQVSNVKAAMRWKANGSGQGLTIDSLRQAKALADKLGGIERARRALDALVALR